MTMIFNLSNLQINLDNNDNLKNKVKRAEIPSFIGHEVDFTRINKLVQKYNKYNNIIIIGNGGSVKSFLAIYNALAEFETAKRVRILTTMEPSIIDNTLKNFDIKDTLVIAISKSGNTVGIIENILIFQNYTSIVITSKDGALYEIGKALNSEVITHPEIGGRFSGGSIVAYLPAALCGIKVKIIDQALRSYYRKFKNLENQSLALAMAFYLLEFNGYSEVYMPVYSHKLQQFGKLSVQLMHESVCKNGKGLTFYMDEAPESQHHTNQRFFGGKRNVIGLFIALQQHDENIKLTIDKTLENIKIKNIELKKFKNNCMAKSLEAEFVGSYQDAVSNKIPVCSIKIRKIDEKTIGEFLGFWHLNAVYSAILRNVNPYDQPQVERSKEISFRLRL